MCLIKIISFEISMQIFIIYTGLNLSICFIYLENILLSAFKFRTTIFSMQIKSFVII